VPVYGFDLFPLKKLATILNLGLQIKICTLSKNRRAFNFKFSPFFPSLAVIAKAHTHCINNNGVLFFITTSLQIEIVDKLKRPLNYTWVLLGVKFFSHLNGNLNKLPIGINIKAQLLQTMPKSPLLYIAMRAALKKPNYRLLVFAWL